MTPTLFSVIICRILPFATNFGMFLSFAVVCLITSGNHRSRALTYLNSKEGGSPFFRVFAAKQIMQGGFSFETDCHCQPSSKPLRLYQHDYFPALLLPNHPVHGQSVASLRRTAPAR